jgi:hypothetical protein
MTSPCASRQKNNRQKQTALILALMTGLAAARLPGLFAIATAYAYTAFCRDQRVELRKD